MRMKGIVFCLMVVVALCWSSKAHALILITEVLADPAAGLAGDANGDGIRSSTQDEFIEIYNSGSETVDVSGWCLSDKTSIRYVFSQGSELPASRIIVIFGGGNPDLNIASGKIS